MYDFSIAVFNKCPVNIALYGPWHSLNTSNFLVDPFRSFKRESVSHELEHDWKLKNLYYITFVHFINCDIKIPMQLGHLFLEALQFIIFQTDVIVGFPLFVRLKKSN